MPLDNRDYMRRPSRQSWRFRRPDGFTLNPLLTIIIINLVFFIATMVAPEGRYPWGNFHQIISDRVTYYLAFIPYYLAERPWTLFSSIFLHSGFIHFFFNMIALFFFGRTLKAFVGENRFLIVYFVGGIAGNLAFWALNYDGLTIVIGASGAIYAIAGALVIMVPKMKILFWGIIPMPLWVFALVFLVILSLPQFAATNVAWQAHFGGLIVGFIAGFFLRRRIRAFTF